MKLNGKFSFTSSCGNAEPFAYSGCVMCSVQSPPGVRSLTDANSLSNLSLNAMPSLVTANDNVSVDSLSSVAELESLLSSTVDEAADIESLLESLLDSSCAKASSRASALSNTSQRASVLSEDGNTLCSVLSSAARTASAVSFRVRVLHERAERTRAALSRVEDVLTLRVCAEGAKTALSAHDLPSAARHIERYLQLDHDVRNDESSAAAVAQITQSMHELSRKVRQRADEALAASPDAVSGDPARAFRAVLDASRLFVPLGLPDEGLRRLADYLSSQVARETDADIRSLLSSSGDQGAVGADEVHIAALSRLFEAVAAYLHDSADEVTQIFGEQAVMELAISLQAQCDVQSTKIIERYIEARRLDEVAHAVRADSANARDLDPLLDELTLLSQRIASYFKYLRENYGQQNDEFRETLNKSKLSALSVELAKRYVAIEAYFMKENARKAIRIDEAPLSEDAHTSTTVDDFFFVLQKCSERSLAYGNLAVEPNVAVMRHMASTLSGDLLPYVRKKLKETQAGMEKQMGGSLSALSSAALSVTFLAEFAKQNIANAAEVAAAASGAKDDAGESSEAKYDFFVAVNNAATSADYALRLRSAIEKTGEAAKTLSQSDRARLSSALVPVSDAAHSLSIASENGMTTLTSALVGQIAAQVDQAIEKSVYIISEDPSRIDDSETSFSNITIRLVDQKVLSDALEQRLTEGNWDTLVRHTAEWVASKTESGLLNVKSDETRKKGKRFNALGAINADRDIRALSKFFASKSRRATVRDVFARLSQIALLLNLERPAEVYDVWGANSGGMAWRLTPVEVRKALLLRQDFSREAIRALKL